MLNSKPNPDIRLQILESVTNGGQPNKDVQPNQPSQENPLNPQNPQDEKQQSELSKDTSNLRGKISGFFSSAGNALSDTVHKYGIDQKKF